jgi:RNA polymerase sigma-70 factor (ECF subfamily)
MDTESAARAIEALVHDYSKLVFHVIYGLTGHWQESEDLTQDTFLQAFRGIEAARAASGPQFQAKAWLLKIAVNTVRMAQRRQRTLRFIAFADLQPGRSEPEQATEVPPAYEAFADADEFETTIAERDVVARCMRQLPATLRTPLLLSVVAGFPSGEIAGMLRLREPTVRQRLARARKTFQRLYAHESGEHIHLGEQIAPRATRRGATRRASRPYGHVLGHRLAALTPAVF